MVDQISPSVAIVGVGVMGGAIATRLLDTGATVIVCDRDNSKTRALTERGARAVASAAEAARGTPFVITSLNSAKIVESAVFGAEGVANAASADTLLIDMSSIDPESTGRSPPVSTRLPAADGSIARSLAARPEPCRAG